MDNTNDARPGENDVRRALAIQGELAGIADEYDLYVARDEDESNVSFGKRLIEELAEKIIDFDNAIERIEELVPDAAMEG